MTIHWIAGIARLNPRTMCGNATFTDESNGTTKVPRPTTNTPNPGYRSASPPDRVIRTRSDCLSHDCSDRLFQCRRGLEANRLARLHLDRLAGPRIEALARLGLAHGERSEAGERELAALFQLFDDGVHQIARRAVGRGTCQIDRLFENLGEERFGHGGFPRDVTMRRRVASARCVVLSRQPDISRDQRDVSRFAAPRSRFYEHGADSASSQREFFSLSPVSLCGP